KLVSMAGLCAAVTVSGLLGASEALARRTPRPTETADQPAPPTTAPPGNPVTPPLASPPSTPSPASPPLRPPTHIDLAVQRGRSRLDDGPAEVTALAALPWEGTVVVGYANGDTRLYALDEPWFEGWKRGPKADGPVRRIDFDRTGQIVYL